jgi:hypothetical protein
MKPKKRFFDTVVGKILLTILPMIIKNQKGIKGTDKAQKVDDVADLLK